MDGDQAHDREHATRSIDWTTVAASAAMLAMVAMQAGSRKAEVQGENGKQVWVRTPAGTTAAVQVQDDDTTEHLRTKVAEHLGIPPRKKMTALRFALVVLFREG